MKTNDKKQLTSENGCPIADNQNTQTAGHRGPVTLQDTWLIEKMGHFDREVIPERRMQTPCLVRFSTVAGERSAADAERDIRGFTMKFYTNSII